jgi:hypothetical protein
VNSLESPYRVLLVNYHRDVVLRASLCYCSHIYVSLKPLNTSTSRDMEQSWFGSPIYLSIAIPLRSCYH